MSPAGLSRARLSTPRFTLRPLEPADVGWLVEMHTDPESMEFIVGGTMSAEDARKFAESQVALDQYAVHFGCWVIENSSGVHGYVALKKFRYRDPAAPDLSDEIEIGYRVCRASWGRGVATEAARRLLAYGFEDQELDRIVAVTWPGNLASRRVLEKIGMRLEKTYPLDGHDWCYFTLTSEEFRQH